MLPWITVPRSAIGAITPITPMPALLMATTDRTGSWAESSSAPVPGITGAGADVAGVDAAGMADTMATRVIVAMLDTEGTPVIAAAPHPALMAAHTVMLPLPEADSVHRAALAAVMPVVDSMAEAVGASTAVAAMAADTGKMPWIY